MASAIAYVIGNGLQWQDAPKDYGSHKTLYSRFIRWSQLGVFDRIFTSLADEGPKPERIMVDAAYVKTRCTAASLLKKGYSPSCRAHQRWPNSNLHTVCDSENRPSGSPKADERPQGHVLSLMPCRPPEASSTNRGYDSAWFRDTLLAKSIKPCIPSSKSGKRPFTYDKILCRQR